MRAILQECAFVVTHYRGSHEYWAGIWKGKKCIVTVDSAYREFDDDLIKSMVRQSGMTREEFYGATTRTAKKIS